MTDPRPRRSLRTRLTEGVIKRVGLLRRAMTLGVRAAVILDGRAPHAVLLELFTEHGAGSIIRAG